MNLPGQITCYPQIPSWADSSLWVGRNQARFPKVSTICSFTTPNTGSSCFLTWVFFFFSFFRILFTYFFLCWVFIAAQAFSLVVASRGYSLVVIRGLIMEASLVAEHRLQGTLASVAVACRLWSTGSIAVVHWLSYSACGIFPDQGSNPCLLHWQVDSLPIELPGKSLTWVFCQLHNQSVSIYCLEFRNLARTQNCKLGWGKKLYLDFQKPLTGNLHFLWL